MSRIRINLEVNCIDFSVLCYDDRTIDRIQVFESTKRINGAVRDVYRDVEWMLSQDAIEAIETKLAEIFAERESAAWEDA